MKKLFTGLMLATASFMLLFTVLTQDVHAVPHQEQFTLVKDPDFDYNIDLYGFLQYAYANYDDGVHPELLVDIDVLTYSTSSVSKAADVFTLTFDTYVIVVDGTTITSTGATISDGTYALDFYLEYETYQDLFYTEAEEIEIFVIDEDNLNAEAFSDLYDALGEVESSDNLLIDGYYNDVPTTFSIFSISSGSSTATIRIPDKPDFDLYFFKLEGDVMYINYGSDLAEMGDVIKLTITEPQLKSWTQAHDYGRIRTNSSTLYLNQQGDTSAYLSHSTSTNVIKVNNIAVGDEIVMQSPYSDFSVSYGNIGFPRTYLVEQENIAAVKMIKNAADNTDYTFVLYYWESGGVTSRVISNVNLANRNSLNIQFKGGFRKALNYSDVMVANVDLLTPLEDFLPNLVAFDPIDGDISDSIVITDNDGYSPDTVGVYNVEFSVTNSNGQTSSIIAPVHVVDIVNPVISGNNDPVIISYHQDFNVAAWVASLTVTDNYYTGLTISIEANTYSSNKTKLGEYSIVVKSTDPSGNTGRFTRTITVVDGVGPVINGMTTITASINENLTAEQIKQSLSAIDAKDGNVTSSLVVDSSNLQSNTPGTYTVTYMAEDSAGNQTYHTVTVTITSQPPGFYIIDNLSVRLLPGANLTIEQILNVLNAQDAQNISTDYKVNLPGTYNLSFTINGEAHTVSITVLGQNESPLPEPILPEEDYNFNWILTLLGGLSLIGLGYIFYKKRK